MLQEELESWRERLDTEKREHDSNRAELEVELTAANNVCAKSWARCLVFFFLLPRLCLTCLCSVIFPKKYLLLEKALADPREYERRFLRKGMELAAIQVWSWPCVTQSQGTCSAQTKQLLVVKLFPPTTRLYMTGIWRVVGC